VLRLRVSVFFALALTLLFLLAPAVMADDDGSAGSLFIPGGKVGLVCAALCGLVILVVWAYIVYFVYNDAEARGQNALAWAAIALVGSWVGLIVWLVVRPEKKM
jgi:hypothetical protein